MYVGLDIKKFRKHMEGHAFAGRVQAVREQALGLGVQGTPTFYVNGRPFELAPPLSTFSQRFEMELDRNKGNCR